ncbi:MAG: hypothetical protein H6737_28065 [Alphaproteobacteria bacterium]|nr:hypothetical protein [Alphaproteobacteria bacterium]
MIHRFLLGLALVAPTVAAAECDTPSRNADLLGALEGASVAFGQLDIESFQMSHTEAKQHLECLTEPISRTTAAEFHRVTGLSLFLERNSPSAAKAFAAARAIEPDYTFPTDLIPEGNPVLETYTQVDPEAGATELVPRPKVGSIKLDGSGSLNRRTALPSIFQLFDGRGAVMNTTLLMPGDALPEYEVPSNAAPEKTAKGGPNIPLLAGAGASLVVAGGLYAGGAATRGAWANADTIAEAESKRGLTNTLVIASGVAGVAAVGLGTTSFVLSGKF